MQHIFDGHVYIPRFMTASVIRPRLAKLDEAPAAAAPAPSLAEVRMDDLTPRQRDVLQCILRGLANKEIARELDIAEGTVKIHLAALFAQFGARNRTELAMRAQTLPR